MITIKNVNPRTGDCEYVGLSTDDKPTEAAVNSTFLELDTNTQFYFDGTEWSQVGGEAPIGR